MKDETQGSLVLSRKVGETICIGDNIRIKFVAIFPDKEKIKLQIIAPKRVPVHREEVYNRIVAEQDFVENLDQTETDKKEN